MTLTLGSVLAAAAINPTEILVIRHALDADHDDGTIPITANSTDEEIREYTSVQSASTRKFPLNPARTWVIFIAEGGDRARLWGVVVNHGEVPHDVSFQRRFNLERTDALADLTGRLVLGWRSPRTWRLTGPTAATYPVMEIADSHPIRFPGFDRLVLDHPTLQAVMREHRYAAWRTALSAVVGIYLITDTRDGRHYVGKADGAENILQRWTQYATNGHGGNVELKRVDPSSFRFSVLRVFDPSTPTSVINAAESHFKVALDSVRHGLNRN
ncbi:GIY-YIG nuclease family protein [Nocardioides sp.]|uniref:GIY-YIG nuclease family protein n=1 Tax=Nocardioides sp. TaxID=35761 RepID=UPI00262C7707|nr:GIY-YIG nuclease family protein [Nocardioides sp.]